MLFQSGCLNGGAQVKQVEFKPNREFINTLEKSYDELPKRSPTQSDHVNFLYDNWLNENNKNEYLFTSYREIKKNDQPLNIKW